MKYIDELAEVDKIISETLKNFVDEEPEDPKSPFGKYAFDTYRKDIPNNEKEKDTPIEKKAWDAVERYIGNNEKAALNNMAPLLLNLVKQGKYKPILDPGRRPVYRLLQLPKELAEKVLRIQITPEQPSGTAESGVLMPTGGGKVSGWMADPSIIREFPGLGSGNVMILFVAGTNGNNFFGAPGKLATAVNAPEYEYEMEVIGLGPIRYTYAAYVMQYDDERHYFDSAETEDELLRLVGWDGE